MDLIWSMQYTGMAMLAYLRQNVSYMIGADIVKNGVALRYMYDPPKDGTSIKHVLDKFIFIWESVHCWFIDLIRSNISNH